MVTFNITVFINFWCLILSTLISFLARLLLLYDKCTLGCALFSIINQLIIIKIDSNKFSKYEFQNISLTNKYDRNGNETYAT